MDCRSESQVRVNLDAHILRVHLARGFAKLKEDCDVMIDQVRAVDNKRFLKKDWRA